MPPRLQALFGDTTLLLCCQTLFQLPPPGYCTYFEMNNQQFLRTLLLQLSSKKQSVLLSNENACFSCKQMYRLLPLLFQPIRKACLWKPAYWITRETFLATLRSSASRRATLPEEVMISFVDVHGRQGLHSGFAVSGATRRQPLTIVLIHLLSPLLWIWYLNFIGFVLFVFGSLHSPVFRAFYLTI